MRREINTTRLYKIMPKIDTYLKRPITFTCYFNVFAVGILPGVDGERGSVTAVHVVPKAQQAIPTVNAAQHGRTHLGHLRGRERSKLWQDTHTHKVCIH